MYNINNFTAVCAKNVNFTLHLFCCLLVHPDKFLILCKWLLRYYYGTYYSDMRHSDRPHNYVSNYIFDVAISSGLTKILPIEKCIFFFWDTLYIPLVFVWSALWTVDIANMLSSFFIYFENIERTIVTIMCSINSMILKHCIVIPYNLLCMLYIYVWQTYFIIGQLRCPWNGN